MLIKLRKKEMRDLADDPTRADARKRLTGLLADNLYGQDLRWVKDGRLIGEPEKEFRSAPNRGLMSQRGWR